MRRELRAILATQQAWAARRGLSVDEAGLLPRLDDNLFEPLSEDVRAALERAHARPLGDGTKPGALQQLTSTAALVCNFFAGDDALAQALAEACEGGPGADPSSKLAVRLAEPIPEPAPELGALEADVWLERAGGRPTALVAHYTEPHAAGAGAHGQEASLGAAWLEARDLWRELPACRALALDLRHNPRRWRHLPVEGLLARAVALGRHHGARGFRLRYAWLDVPGSASGSSRALRDEIDRFRQRVGGEVDFAARSWQALHAAAAARGGSSRLAWLAERYLAA